MEKIEKLVDVGNEIIDILNESGLNYMEGYMLISIIKEKIEKDLNGEKENDSKRMDEND